MFRLFRKWSDYKLVSSFTSYEGVNYRMYYEYELYQKESNDGLKKYKQVLVRKYRK